MNNRWLTLITITKDDPVALDRTLASASALRLAGAEQVVIDGSSNPAGAPLSTGAATVSPVICARPARGIADAFNAGLALAQGEWIWFLNGGDRVDPRLTAEFLRPLLEKTPADVIIGGLTYEGQPAPQPPPPPHKRWPPFRSWIPHPATLVRRRLFEKFGTFDERYSIAMDYEWFLRVLPTGVPVVVLDEPFAVFAPGGISQRPESLARIQCEQNDAIRRHQAAFWRPSLPLLYRLGRALFSPRLGRPANSP